MTHDEMIAVIQAHKNGGKAEYRGRSEITWTPVSGSPLWNFAAYDYRIKPEPRSLWEVRSSRGKHDSAWLDKADAEMRASLVADCTVTEYKEVLP